LLESELFGHEKGAFTGALLRKPGRFELASGGTILLDEIGEMPLSLQSKILHVLQDNEFFRVGGRELISVDVRILAATNKNIQTMLASGGFREDLYYRLNVVNIFVPPLRERRAEIPALIEHFREKFVRQFNRRSAPVSADTLELLLAYRWPGNVRELENLIKRYVVVGDEAHLRDELHVRLKLVNPQPPSFLGGVDGVDGVDGGDGLRAIALRAARKAEKIAINEMLERVGWNRAAAARLLKVSYKTLLSKINHSRISQAGGGGHRPPM
jgi:transcriptional regulator with GAF, ATPase, and Fis domain